SSAAVDVELLTSPPTRPAAAMRRPDLVICVPAVLAERNAPTSPSAGDPSPPVFGRALYGPAALSAIPSRSIRPGAIVTATAVPGTGQRTTAARAPRFHSAPWCGEWVSRPGAGALPTVRPCAAQPPAQTVYERRLQP